MSFILITPQSLGLNAIPKITWGSFRGQRGKRRGSFRGRDHFGVDLGIISGLEIISGAVQRALPASRGLPAHGSFLSRRERPLLGKGGGIMYHYNRAYWNVR